jgi:hypothetical protein
VPVERKSEAFRVAISPRPKVERAADAELSSSKDLAKLVTVAKAPAIAEVK